MRGVWGGSEQHGTWEFGHFVFRNLTRGWSHFLSDLIVFNVVETLSVVLLATISSHTRHGSVNENEKVQVSLTSVLT